MNNDYVWIELYKPRDDIHAQEICDKANRMMVRLGITEDRFFWSKRDNGYCWGGNTGYITLTDRGHWFSLDYLGKEA